MLRRCSRVLAFKYGGSPVTMKGDGSTITSSALSFNTMSSGAMKIHCLSGYISNLYLCQYCDLGNELLLLDTGMPKDVDRVAFFANKMILNDHNETGGDDGGAFFENLKMVVSTHCHIDHVGATWAYREKGVPVAVADRYEDYYMGTGGKTQQVIDAALATLFARRLGRRVEWPFQPSTISKEAALDERLRMKDGSSVPNFPDWVAIGCPGHTCHMNMLYHPESHILYAADFFVAHKNEFRAPVPVDLDYAYSHTLHRLRGLPVRYVLLAHGGIVDCEDVGGWQAILDDVVAHRMKKDSHPTLLLIRNFLLGYSPEPKQYDRSRLPRGPLPRASEEPPFVAYLK